MSVQIDVYVLVDVNTGEQFTRPAGTTGDDDGDLDTTEPVETPGTTPPATDPSTEQPSGDVAAWCAQWQTYTDQYGVIDPTAPELRAIFEDLTNTAPTDIKPQMEILLAAVLDATSRGLTEVDEAAYPEATGAITALLAYLQTNCPGLVPG